MFDRSLNPRNNLSFEKSTRNSFLSVGDTSNDKRNARKDSKRCNPFWYQLQWVNSISLEFNSSNNDDYFVVSLPPSRKLPKNPTKHSLDENRKRKDSSTKQQKQRRISIVDVAGDFSLSTSNHEFIEFPVWVSERSQTDRDSCHQKLPASEEQTFRR